VIHKKKKRKEGIIYHIGIVFSFFIFFYQRQKEYKKNIKTIKRRDRYDKKKQEEASKGKMKNGSFFINA